MNKQREILFRGKTKAIAGSPYNNGKADGEWVKGYLYDDVGCLKIRQFETDYADYVPYEVAPETVGQYTGVKVGSEKLFEGDIVEWHEDYDDTFGYSQTAVGRSVVIWDTDNFCWAFKTDDEYIQAFNDWNWNSSYIIGNIHDNPELLKGDV